MRFTILNFLNYKAHFQILVEEGKLGEIPPLITKTESGRNTFGEKVRVLPHTRSRRPRAVWRLGAASRAATSGGRRKFTMRFVVRLGPMLRMR